MQIAEILSSQLVPGALVIDLTTDDAELSVSALLPPELRVSYRRQLLADTGERPELALLVQRVKDSATTVSLERGLKQLAGRVVHAVLLDRLEALADHELLAAATREGWELSAVHATDHPVWRAAAVLTPAAQDESGDGLKRTNEQRLDEYVLKARGAELTRALARTAELEAELAAASAELVELRPLVAQSQRLAWKLNRRNERVRELEAELESTNKLLVELRRALSEALNKARTSQSKLDQYRRALGKARGSVSFRLGRATKVALRGNPLGIPRRWIETYNGHDEVLEKLGHEGARAPKQRSEPAKEARLPAKQALAAWWDSPGIVNFRKRTQRSWQKLVTRAEPERRKTAIATPPDVTQQWLHIVTPPPPGSPPSEPRLTLPPPTAPLPPSVDVAAFDETWRQLCQSRASAACIGKLAGKQTDDMDEALRALLPVLVQKRLIDAPIAPVEGLVIKPPNFRSYTLPTPIDWTADPKGVRDWRFWLQNLGWLDRLRGTSAEGLTAAAYIVVDWAERALSQDPPLEMTWEEHSVGIRLARVWRFLQAYIASGDVLNRRILHAAVHIVLTHVYALTRKEIYAAQHNHGLMQDQALLTHVAQLPTLRDHDALLALGEYRILHLQVARSVTEDAVHHENSPHYHILFAKILATVLNEAYAVHGRKAPEALLRARDALLETFVYLLQPDMTVPQMGDSVNESREPELAFVLEQTQKSFPLPAALLDQIQYVRTDGKQGKAPPHIDRVFVEGGYACFREKWTPGSAKKVVTAHFRCSRLSNVHYHQDETSFEIYGYGQKLIAESGRYNNDKGSPLHTYQRSTHAHNVLTVDGQGFGRAKLTSRIVDHRIGRYLSWVQGSHDYYATLGIKEYVRTFAYSKYNFFVVLDSLFAKGPHAYDQHIHLHPSLSKLSFPVPGTVVATTEGNGPAVVLTSGTPPESIRTVRGKDAETGEESWYFPDENVAQPATDVIFRHRRDAGRVHLPLFVMVFPSAESVELLPIEHEVTDRELAVAIEPLRYARHIVLPLHQFAAGATADKKSRHGGGPEHSALSNKLASGG